MPRSRWIGAGAFAACAAMAVACHTRGRKARGDERALDLTFTPLGLPTTNDPPENPTTAAKVALGRALFFDRRLSEGDFMSCEGCHAPRLAYATSTATNANVAGKITRRNSPSVINVGYFPALGWDGRASTIEAISMVAWKNQLSADPVAVAGKLAADRHYDEGFRAVFGSPPTPENVPKALAAFIRALRSGGSPYDRYLAGDASALDERAARGKGTFTSLGCPTCHSGPLFTDGAFHDVGIGAGPTTPGADRGRGEVTGRPEDAGKFRTPSLREVARTAPYFHDGSAATLEDAVRISAERAGRATEGEAPRARRRVTPEQVDDVVAFLRALSGDVTPGPPSGRPAD